MSQPRYGCAAAERIAGEAADRRETSREGGGRGILSTLWKNIGVFMGVFSGLMAF